MAWIVGFSFRWMIYLHTLATILVRDCAKVRLSAHDLRRQTWLSQLLLGDFFTHGMHGLGKWPLWLCQKLYIA